MTRRFFFCPKCGGRLYKKHDGEMQRLTCGGCGFIFYENPAVGVAAVVIDPEGRILLGRRKGSRAGLWCIPCGYVEYHEEVRQAAVREFKEETNLDIAITGIASVQSNFHNPEAHTVGIWFWAEVKGGDLKPGGDLDRVDFFPPDNLPPLAFPADAKVIDGIRSQSLQLQGPIG